MSFSLGSASRAELAGVHPCLQDVVERAIAITTQDFLVHDGLRSLAEQRKYVSRGASKTMSSKHMRQSTGFGHAVDLVPFIDGEPRWEWKPIFRIAEAVRAAALERKVALIWGGVWDRELNQLGSTAGELEKAVNGYVSRRRSAGKTAFIDGPHYQLAAGSLPGK